MKNVLSMVVLFLFFLVSCSSRTSVEGKENATLKYTAANLDSITEWTKSVDVRILEENLSAVKGIAGSIEVSAELFPLSMALSRNRKIFPSIRDGFSLDVSSLPSGYYDCIDGFCKSFMKDEQPDGFFEHSFVYSLTMFSYDFQRLYGDKGIAWYAIGEPFVSDDFYLFPVRFFLGNVDKKSGKSENKNFNDSHVDIQIGCRKSGGTLKIVSVDLLMRESGESEN